MYGQCNIIENKSVDNLMKISSGYCKFIMDPQVFTLPPLYSTDKRGNRRVWKVWAVDDKVFKYYGLVDGKCIESSRVIKATRDNDAIRQAQLTAERDWIKQLDKAYRPDPSDKIGTAKADQLFTKKLKQGGTNHGIVPSTTPTTVSKTSKKEKPKNCVVESVGTMFLPMQCTKFDTSDKCLKHFDFQSGVFVQPKYDGWRCIAKWQENGEVTLTTRTGKQYPWFKHIREEVKKFLIKHPHVVLDGEVYVHDLKDDDGISMSPTAKFSLIQSMCGMKRSVPHPRETELQYHVFDVVDVTKLQGDRTALLEQLRKDYKGSVIQVAPTYRCFSVSEIESLQHTFEHDSYEGAVVRAHDLKYQGKSRSLKMRKLKEFEDAEFTVCGFRSAEGDHDGCVVWKCRTDSGAEFDVAPKGTLEYKRRLYNEADRHIGRLLKVKYQGLSTDGVPRFPVGIGFREEFEV